MNEQRKNNRLELHTTLVIKEITVEGQAAQPIEVIDISRNGLGFLCDQMLEIGHVYEGYLSIWTKDMIHVFLEVVRIEKKEEGIYYGAVFIGMPEVDLSRISVYEMFESNKK